MSYHQRCSRMTETRRSIIVAICSRIASASSKDSSGAPTSSGGATSIVMSEVVDATEESMCMLSDDGLMICGGTTAVGTVFFGVEVRCTTQHIHNFC